jgi:hypothetical protein
MKKTKLVFSMLSVMLLLFSFTGCEYFWPSNDDNKVVLPPKIVSSIFSYNTQPVKKGMVKKIRSLTATFSSAVNIDGNVHDMGELFFICTVTSDQYNLLNIGEKGTIVLDNTIPKTPQFGKNITYNAQVLYAPDRYGNSTSYIIKIIDNYDKNIVKEETLATFQILDQEKDNVLMIPKAAVKSYLSKSYVGILKNGSEEDTMITVGLIGTDSVEVLGGLSVGELVIIN